VQMIAAYRPARGKSERSFWDLARAFTAGIRLAGITTAEGANAFLRDGTSGSLTASSKCRRRRKEHAFRRTQPDRPELDLHGANERVVEKDNTVAVRDRWWQIDQDTIPQQPGGSTGNDPRTPDGTVSIRYGLM